ncbi:uncharacterized protein LOC111086347 [Limulus polyphemus]|uniref:Uncharacterized protein LOC111086347 n=1 Tax=Limulus polyphemus TaxID=6850 RepID=A0ABM1SLM6_LIMPO|nr:uncharacterized protein LOC111086347 [Limulus polyphemus]
MCSWQLLISVIALSLQGLSGNAVATQEMDDVQLLDHYPGNKVLRLIIQTYMENLLQDLQQHASSPMSSLQMARLTKHMNEFYDYVAEHPALHQRRLWVGKEKPTFVPNTNYHGNIADEFKGLETKLPTNQKSKRGSIYPSEEICSTETTWIQINLTTDVYNKPVEVIQQDDLRQFVFSFKCVTAYRPCSGISTLYESECIERLGWVYMYYRRLDDFSSKEPQWGPVAVPHHCACKITPKYFPDI